MNSMLVRVCLLLAVAAFAIGGSCNGGPKPPIVTILTPANGVFTTAGSIAVTGTVERVAAVNAIVLVNGVAATVLPDLTWSINATLDPAKVFNPLEVVASNAVSGKSDTELVTVIVGDSVNDGDLSPQSVALRINDSGLDAVEPVITSLINLDVASLIPPGTVVLDNFCYQDSFLGCIGRVDVTISGSPPPTLGSVSIDVDSQTNQAHADIVLTDLDVTADADDASGIPFSCTFDISAASTTIPGDYTLEPELVGDPSNIDVSQIGNIDVVLGGFSSSTDCSGILGFLVEFIIGLVIGDVQGLFEPGLEGFLNTTNPTTGNTPIADAVQTALSDITISGPIGESLGVLLETPLFQVVEDNDGITLGSDTRVTANFGTGVGQCDPPPGSPDLLASLSVPEPFPSFSANTPVGGTPYGLGICISTGAFNQLLKAEIECGLLQVDLTEIDIGLGLEPLTTDLLALFIPELAQYPAGTPMVIELRPELAPALTGNPGPGGEIAELRTGGLTIALKGAGAPINNQLIVGGSIDFRAGLDFTFDNLTGSLVPSIGTVTAADVGVVLTQNPIGTDETTLIFVLTTLLPLVLPDLGDSLGAFPLPDFLGLSLQGVEVSANGEFLSLFVDLVPAP